MTYTLTYTISNAVTAETVSDVKVRAPQTFYTQDRMVSSIDYNVYPLIKSTDIKKIKSINRTHAGHSRYIDINDPTGTIANTNVFGEDGILYKEPSQQEKTATFDTNLNIEQLIKKHIEVMFGHDSLTNFFYEDYRNSILSQNPDELTLQGNNRLVFNTDQSQAMNNVGVLAPQVGTPTNWTTSGLDANSQFKLIRELCVLEYVNSVTSKTENVVVQNITDRTDDTGHRITLKRNVPNGSQIRRIIPVFRRVFNTIELNAIEEAIIQSNTFGIAYDYTNSTTGLPSFRLVNENDIAPEDTISFNYTADVTSNNQDSSWLVKCQYIGNNQYRITSRGVRYIFESDKETRFFFNNEFKTVDTATGTSKKDSVTVLATNLDNKKQLEFVRVTNPGIGYVDNTNISIAVANNDGVNITTAFTPYLSINDTVAGTGADAWATGVMSQNQSSLNNTTHIIENRYKNDGSGQETDSYANLSATLPFYINLSLIHI